MPWPQKSLTAKEILGMEQEEFKTKLDSAASKDDLSKINTAVEAQGNTITEIRTMLQKLTAPDPPPPDPNLKLDADDPTTQMLTDPAGFINRQTAGTQQVAAQARADVLEMRARSAYPQVFSKWGNDLMASAKNFSLAQRAQEGFWDFHIKTFTGGKVLAGEVDEGSYPSLVGSSSFAPNTTGERDDPNGGFPPEMAQYFRDRKIPLESARKFEQMRKDGTEISLENYRNVKVAHA